MRGASPDYKVTEKTVTGLLYELAAVTGITVE